MAENLEADGPNPITRSPALPGAAAAQRRPSPVCPGCGTEVLEREQLPSLLGHCPTCLLAQGAQPPSHELKDCDFGDYKLVRQVGRGAMGVVYEAVQLRLQRPVALKMMSAASLAPPGMRRRFLIEAEAAAKLSHPNIVPIYDYGEWQGQPFLTMKLVNGGSLKDKLALTCASRDRHSPVTAPRQGLPRAERTPRAATDYAETARFMGVIADAVAHAHDHGVLHRDLKPGNILIDAAGQPHLTDFSLAKIMRDAALGEDPTVPGSICGTPSYMAPEQARGGTCSFVSDVYSLGAVFYELLTGQPPFKAPTAIETLRLVSDQEPRTPRALNPSVPRDLEIICLKCLEKEPAARYASAAEFAADLNRWLEGRPIAARPASLPIRCIRWCRRNPAGTALVLVLSVALATSLMLLESRQHQERVANRALAILREEFELKAEEQWANPHQDSLMIGHPVLAVLGGFAPQPANDTNTLRLTFGMENSDDPIARATAAAHFFRLLEKRMKQQLDRPVTFSLLLQKHRPDVGAPAVSGTVDFQRLGPLAYIRAKEQAPGLRILARENSSMQGVLFASRRSGITNLAGLERSRIAFAHSNSIVSFAAKLHLVRAGFTATNFAANQHLDPPRVKMVLADADEAGELSGEFVFAHRVVIDGVLSNAFDVGEARLKHFEQNRHLGLVELTRFDVPPRVYIAGPKVDARAARAFQEALCSMTAADRLLCEKFFAAPCTGFTAAVDEDLENIHRALNTELRRFESRP